MKRILINLYIIVGIVCIAACKDPMDEITTLDLDRALSPTDLSATVYNQTGVNLTWKTVSNADSYTIEIFDNESFSGSPEKTIEGVLPYEIPYLVTGLGGQTKYYVRVKAVGEGIADSKWISGTFTTGSEQILENITAEKITTTSVTLNWPAGEVATSVKLTPGDITHTITAEEVAAGEATVTGLTPGVTYEVVLYRNNSVRGRRTFTTPSDMPPGSNIVYVGAGDDLAALIASATATTTFALQPGTKYTTDDVVKIPAGISLTIWGATGTQRPVIAFNGFELPGSAGIITFENVDITGYQDNDIAKVKRNYIFNQNTASTTTGIVFENCVIRNLVNCAVRLQTGGTITVDKVSVNNCIVYDIGDNGTNGTYAFINTNVANATINNITLTNNTFYKIGYGIIQHSTTSSQSLVVENNTFNNVVGNARYLIDYNNSSASSVSFRNNIVGKTLSPAATARGIRIGTTVTAVDSYQTSDAVFAGNPISGIKSYGKSSYDLFNDPDNGNFSIKDGFFEGASTAGDPRWRP